MNIFYTHHLPSECARDHCDKHLVKMVLETAQLLSTAHHVIDGVDARPNIYAKTHTNHPSALWVRQSMEHYGWTRDLLQALGEEYTHRYGKNHKTIREVLPALILPPKGMPMDGGWTPPPQCMPDEYKTQATEVAYQRYIRNVKGHFCKWTKRVPPSWFY